MNIFVIGASGFLGRHLCRFLKKTNEVEEASTKNCNLLNPQSLNRFNTKKYDQIYHLAAWTQAGDFCLYHPGDQWLINQQINTSVLSWWKNHQPQAKLICTGTSCSYDPKLPLIEENYLRGDPIESLYTYAMTKRMLLNGLLSIHKQYGLSYLYVIPSTLYGPDYHVDSRQAHFIFDLIYKIYAGVYENKEVILWGDGSQKRELVFVEDFVHLMTQLAKVSSNTSINIGSGEGYSIREFANRISDILGYHHQWIHYDTTKYVGAKSKILSIEKLKKILPTYRQVSLNEGLMKTVEWYRSLKKKDNQSFSTMRM